MSETPPPRWPRVLGVAALVVGGYALGVATGIVGSGAPPEPPRSYGVLDEAARQIEAQAARAVDPAALQRAAVEGMLRAVGDRWSRYLGPSEFDSFRDALEGRYSGVGLWLTQRRGAVVVSGVQEGSPAEAGGILPGDVVVAVDDEHGDGLADVSRLLRGDQGTRVTLTLSRDGASTRVTLTRAGVTTDDVEVERLSGGIEVVRVAAFTRGVGRQVRDALDASSPTDARSGVVLDLRGNPGGLLTEAVDVAGAFLDGGPVVSYETRSEGTRTLDALGTGNTTTPVVVLVDRNTASAAEVVAAALQDRNRAIVVGARTYGKGSVQQSADLSDGSAIELTVGRYLTPSGRQIDGVGVEPDVLADPRGPDGAAAAEQRALEVLRGLVAATGGPG